jgi:tripartite-type tricarboxylate transporter receptor subunit TctC
MTDLIGGQLQLMFENQPVVLPQIRSGKVRGLAVGTTKRSALLPELPTMVEAGVPGYESSTAFGVLAPARTPRELVDRLSTEIARILHSQEIRERLSAQGLEPVGSTPEQYAAQIRDELAKNARIVKLSGIKAD